MCSEDIADSLCTLRYLDGRVQLSHCVNLCSLHTSSRLLLLLLGCFRSVVDWLKMNKLFYSSKEKYLEEYMVLNMKTENGKVGQIEN